MSVPVRTALVPRHSWLGCAVWVCAPQLGFRLRPASPGWGVGVCVCVCVRSACIPPLLAGVCGLVVCPWARVSACPCHSWLGCWGVCVFVCAHRLQPANLGRGVGVRVSLCARSACTLPLLDGVRGIGLCASAPVSAAPPHSWQGCWRVCVLVCTLRLCTPLLAGVCGVGVCACARGFAAPRHSWPGC